MKLPYTEVAFDAKGAYVDPDQVAEVAKVLADKRPDDIIVVTHGWNNTEGQARALYERLIASIVAVRPRVAGAQQRRFVVVGVLWPSIQWAAEESAGAGAGVGDAEAEGLEDRALAVRGHGEAAQRLRLGGVVAIAAPRERRFARAGDGARGAAAIMLNEKGRDRERIVEEGGIDAALEALARVAGEAQRLAGARDRIGVARAQSQAHEVGSLARPLRLRWPTTTRLSP